jgi:hypothetical protein
MKLSSWALPSSLSPVIRMTYLLLAAAKIGVGVDHRLTHALGVVDVLAEDDRLGETVRVAEELGDLGSDEFGALFEDQIPVEVAVVVFAVLDDLAVFVRLPGSGRQPSRSLSRPMRTTL